MHKAPVGGSTRRKEPPTRSPYSPIPSPSSSTNPYRRESPGAAPLSPSTSGSTASRPSRFTLDTLDTQTDILDGFTDYGDAPGSFLRADPGQHRMEIAIDYGTTFSGIGYTVHDNSRPILSKIDVIMNWGKDMDNDVKIPSVYSYSPCSEADEQQFGASLSPEAVAMVNTKLELDAQDTRLDELDLIVEALEGMKDLNFEYVQRAQGWPGYTWKNPEDIVTDYLAKAFEHFEKATEYLTEIKMNVPVDIVITVPVRWSYRAKNSTLRAIRNAGFNEHAFPHLDKYIMVTEPEAAALYTARYLKEHEAEDLRLKDCFVLCDAGGGTVDVVAYKVKQTSPSLELEQMTVPTGAKCGASFINRTFREWLQEELGDEYYNMLDPRSDSERVSAHATEGGAMRRLMQSFELQKKAFKGTSADMQIELPSPLHKINIPGRVEEGVLTITNDDMRFFFDDCINEVIDLIQSQIAQVEEKRNRVKTIFLIGGFSESEFLQEELATSLIMRKIKLRRPQTSWSAVVRGAVLYGMEALNRKNQIRCTPCPRNYGFVMNHTFMKRMHDARDIYTNPFTNQTMAKSQFDWFVLKGDLLLEKETREIEKSVTWNFNENAAKVCRLRIFEYTEDDLPERFENAHEEVTQVATLSTDLSHLANENFERCHNRTTGVYYYRVCLIVKFTLSGTSMKCELWFNDQVMFTHTLENVDKVTPAAGSLTD